MVTKWGLSLLSPNQTLNNQLIMRIFQLRKIPICTNPAAKLAKKINMRQKTHIYKVSSMSGLSRNTYIIKEERPPAFYSRSSEVMSRQVLGLMFSFW